MSKAINELIKKYQLEIKIIKLERAKLEREIDTLREVIMDLEELLRSQNES